MTIMLNWDKAINTPGAIVDRYQMLQKYDVVKYDINGDTDTIKQPMKLVVGSPMLVCCEGTYVDTRYIMDILDHRSYRNRREIAKWLGELKNPPSIGRPVEWKWYRA